MPRLPEPRTPVLRELARQLRFQPADASQRQLGRAEELALQLLVEHAPERQWPAEWVVFRVTGYRSEQLSGAIEGRALQRDLAALIQILSAAGGVTEAGLRGSEPSRWISTKALCARWGVSRQTLDRYRDLGLFSRRVEAPRQGGGRSAPHRTVYDAAVVEAFEHAHRETLDRAGGFSRIDAALAKRLYRRACRYQRLLGWSLSRVAQRLAPHVGRSAGAVRRAIVAEDTRSATPLFAGRRTLRASKRSDTVREYRRGERARNLAHASSRSRASVYRMVVTERARRLRELNLTAPARPDFAEPAAANKLLSIAAVSQGLGQPLPHTLAELIEQAAAVEPAAPRERAMCTAYALLRFQADRGIAALGAAPTVLGATHRGRASARPAGAGGPADGGIDWIETRLRWASRVKAELIRSQLGLLLRTVDSQLGRQLASFAGAIAADITASLASALFEAADRHDPFKGGRLAAPAGLALNRAAAKWAEEHPRELGPSPSRTLARPAPSHARLDHIWMSLNPWTSWLEPPPGARERVELFTGRGRDVIIARLGWDAHPPRTVHQTALELQLTPLAVIRAERTAMRQLL